MGVGKGDIMKESIIPGIGALVITLVWALFCLISFEARNSPFVHITYFGVVLFMGIRIGSSKE